ncbi:hypothetical protein EJ357_24095 [Streptomyces cyaneochromogenes]|uniref:Uncharacterized protein n=1 Tax=Streptomyces cyaneochromogenes TaxID=2496836 RepID=A0A3S9MAJ0_9ACTN|nr:hypothetical protein EJ357_24095 [Streptomyces cyaneochromogenes]
MQRQQRSPRTLTFVRTANTAPLPRLQAVPIKRTSTDPQYQFRVCGSLISDGRVECSDWW